MGLSSQLQGALTESKVDPKLWRVERRFGAAGGPDRVVLTDYGNQRAFAVGSRVSGKEADALIMLYSQGGMGDFSVRHGARMRPTDLLMKFDMVVWGKLKQLGLAEGHGPDGIRLTSKGRAAVERGFEEQKNLLARISRQERISA